VQVLVPMPMPSKSLGSRSIGAHALAHGIKSFINIYCKLIMVMVMIARMMKHGALTLAQALALPTRLR
jgi:hypothetical protein